jgi:nitronate monooxygenase
MGDQTVRGILFDIARRNVWPAPYTGRLLRNKFSEKWRVPEAELLQHQNEEAEKYSEAREKGDFDIAGVIAGEAVDLIADIPRAAEIVDRMVNEAVVLLQTVIGSPNKNSKECRATHIRFWPLSGQPTSPMHRRNAGY